MRVVTGWIATCLVVLGICSVPAHAAVIFVDIVPDRIVEQGTFIPDVNGDGDRDLLFDHTLGCVGNCRSAAQVGGIGGQVLVTLVGPTAEITPLAAGTLIGPASSLFAPGGLFAEDRFAGVPPVTGFEDGLWDNGLTAFLGFSFLIGANTHYGWARVNIEETSNIITVYGFGYESTPGASIRAGSVPEPGTLALAAIGLAALIRRHRANPAS